MKLGIKVKKVYLEDRVLENSIVILEDGLIKSILNSKDEKNLDLDKILNMENYNLMPGLIDTHIHGGASFDTMDGDFESINEISKYLSTRGVTSFVPTTVTDDVSNIKIAVENVKKSIGKVEGAEILGSYVEGPYLTKEHKGAHPEKLLKHIDIEEIKEILKVGEGTVKTITIAPEKENSIESIKYITEKNVNVSMGHTSSNYNRAIEAIDAGAKIAVHIYNGMRGLKHREPNFIGAALTRDDVYCELIADMIHVHPAAIDIVLRCKGKDKVVLISDAMRAGGLKDGEYMLGTLKVIVKDGVARTESGSLAGSTTNLMYSIKNMLENLPLKDIEAINMASLNPAKLLKLDKEIGSIKEGKKANLVVVDDDFKVIKTLVNGKIVYEN
ncbi:N-acetylglucosamine-6-phosphate deacetylase [Clostridium oceanicum]|uniref:N-acetylglucosamine-6-phosphate deacetylase n=1 Tax=Clostridium oceanicum TaxID=1543 RepID=A0ABP3UX23_9CLOT